MKAEFIKDDAGRDISVSFEGPGCKMGHSLYVDATPADIVGPRWSFNGNLRAPTFHPSIKVTGGLDDKGHWNDKAICHSFVVDGRIQFLGDCTHALAGQTVDLPEVET